MERCLCNKYFHISCQETSAGNSCFAWRAIICFFYSGQPTLTPSTPRTEKLLSRPITQTKLCFLTPIPFSRVGVVPTLIKVLVAFSSYHHGLGPYNLMVKRKDHHKLNVESRHCQNEGRNKKNCQSCLSLSTAQKTFAVRQLTSPYCWYFE